MAPITLYITAECVVTLSGPSWACLALVDMEAPVRTAEVLVDAGGGLGGRGEEGDTEGGGVRGVRKGDGEGGTSDPPGMDPGREDGGF